MIINEYTAPRIVMNRLNYVLCPQNCGSYYRNTGSYLKRISLSSSMVLAGLLVFSSQATCGETFEIKADYCPGEAYLPDWKLQTAIFDGDVEYIKKAIHPRSPKEKVTHLLEDLLVKPMTQERVLIGKYLVEMGADPNARVLSCNKGQASSPVVPGHILINSDINLQFGIYLLENGLKPTAELAISTIRSTHPNEFNRKGYSQVIERSRILMDAYVKHGLLKQGKVDYANVAAPFRVVSDAQRNVYRSYIGELLSKGILDPDTPLFGAYRPYEAKLFLDHGGNPAATNNKGETPLHLAVVGGGDPVPLVWLFLAHGNREKFSTEQLESAAALSNNYLVKKLIRGDETATATLLVKDVPHLSKEDIRSPDFYKHAMGMIEQDGVKAYYGLVAEASEPNTSYFYMLFENQSGQWLKPGYTILGGSQNSNPEFGVSDFLSSPIASSGTHHPLSLGYQIHSDWSYQISLEIDKPSPLLQKYLEVQPEGDQSIQEGIYKQIPLNDEIESKTVLKALNLKNGVGFAFDHITNWACGNKPSISLTKYHHLEDNIYIYRSDCFTWGGEGSEGSQFLTIFRLDSKGSVINLYTTTNNNDWELQGYILNKEFALSDLDLDGNPELSLMINMGVGGDEAWYEIEDGKLKNVLHIDSWEEGEGSASECSVGYPFQDCQGW